MVKAGAFLVKNVHRMREDHQKFMLTAGYDALTKDLAPASWGKCVALTAVTELTKGGDDAKGKEMGEKIRNLRQNQTRCLGARLEEDLCGKMGASDNAKLFLKELLPSEWGGWCAELR